MLCSAELVELQSRGRVRSAKPFAEAIIGKQHHLVPTAGEGDEQPIGCSVANMCHRRESDIDTCDAVAM